MKKTKDMDCDILHWIFVPKNRARWHILLDRVTNFRVPCKAEWTSLPQIHRNEKCKKSAQLLWESARASSVALRETTASGLPGKIYEEKMTELKSKIGNNFLLQKSTFLYETTFYEHLFGNFKFFTFRNESSGHLHDTADKKNFRLGQFKFREWDHTKWNKHYLKVTFIFYI